MRKYQIDNSLAISEHTLRRIIAIFSTIVSEWVNEFGYRWGYQPVENFEE